MSSIQPIQPNPQTQNKSTEQTPNIMQSFNRHGLNEFDKSKQEEVSWFLNIVNHICLGPRNNKHMIVFITHSICQFLLTTTTTIISWFWPLPACISNRSYSANVLQTLSPMLGRFVSAASFHLPFGPCSIRMSAKHLPRYTIFTYLLHTKPS